MTRTRFHALPERDKRVLAIGTVVVALLLAWAFVWYPLAQKREQIGRAHV